MNDRISNICKDFFFCFLFLFPNLTSGCYIEIYENESSFPPPTTSHTKISEIIVFIHILKIVFGLQNKLLFWDIIIKRKLKNLFLLVTFFYNIFCIHAPLLSFISYPVSDEISRKQRGGEGELVSSACFKY